MYLNIKLQNKFIDVILIRVRHKSGGNLYKNATQTT